MADKPSDPLEFMVRLLQEIDVATVPNKLFEDCSMSCEEKLVRISIEYLQDRLRLGLMLGREFEEIVSEIQNKVGSPSMAMESVLATICNIPEKEAEEILVKFVAESFSNMLENRGAVSPEERSALEKMMSMFNPN